mgnify:CR=1 FL=1
MAEADLARILAALAARTVRVTIDALPAAAGSVAAVTGSAAVVGGGAGAGVGSVRVGSVIEVLLLRNLCRRSASRKSRT